MEEEAIKSIRRIHVMLILLSAATLAISIPAQNETRVLAIAELEKVSPIRGSRISGFRPMAVFFTHNYQRERLAKSKNSKENLVERNGKELLVLIADPYDLDTGLFQDLTFCDSPGAESPVALWVAWFSTETSCETLEVDYGVLAHAVAQHTQKETAAVIADLTRIIPKGTVSLIDGERYQSGIADFAMRKGDPDSSFSISFFARIVDLPMSGGIFPNGTFTNFAFAREQLGSDFEMLTNTSKLLNYKGIASKTIDDAIDLLYMDTAPRAMISFQGYSIHYSNVLVAESITILVVFLFFVAHLRNLRNFDVVLIRHYPWVGTMSDAWSSFLFLGSLVLPPASLAIAGVSTYKSSEIPLDWRAFVYVIGMLTLAGCSWVAYLTWKKFDF